MPDPAIRVVIDFSVPQEWAGYADDLDQIADVLRRYLELNPIWTDTSLAASDKTREDQFSSLPFQHPMSTALAHPVMALGQAVDHLAALAAIVRTERTALAMHTVIRPILVAAGIACYVADPAIDTKERMRRAVNIELQSDTEMMHLCEGRYPKQLEQYDRRRREIVKGARQIWRVNAPESKKPKKGRVRVLDWYVGDRPSPGDMGFVRKAHSYVAAEEIADVVYRLMSASTHAQPHALLTFLQRDQAEYHELGYAAAALGTSTRALMIWLLAPTTALWGAVVNCTELYAWDPQPWRSVAIPRMVAWNNTLMQIARQEFIDRTGLWLPPDAGAIQL